MLKHATMDQLNEVLKIFRKYNKIFPYMRKDKLQDKIIKNEVIYDDGVVITFSKYKKKVKLGDVVAEKGVWSIQEIVNSDKGNGKATEVMKRFLDFVDSDVYLTVRADNEDACQFYDEHGFKIIGNITWRGGEIAGLVYKKSLTNSPFFGIIEK